MLKEKHLLPFIGDTERTNYKDKETKALESYLDLMIFNIPSMFFFHWKKKHFSNVFPNWDTFHSLRTHT